MAWLPSFFQTKGWMGVMMFNEMNEMMNVSDEL